MADIYHIRVKEHLDDRWAGRFEGFTLIHPADGTTLLSGPVPDQAALHGLLMRVRDLGLTLLVVARAEHQGNGATGTDAGHGQIPSPDQYL
jgi:hypothetical protein